MFGVGLALSEHLDATLIQSTAALSNTTLTVKGVHRGGPAGRFS
jgi:hypothetical protein